MKIGDSCLIHRYHVGWVGFGVGGGFEVGVWGWGVGLV